jgi:hypothetical protein
MLSVDAGMYFVGRVEAGVRLEKKLSHSQGLFELEFVLNATTDTSVLKYINIMHLKAHLNVMFSWPERSSNFA